MQYANCPSCNKRIPENSKFCGKCGELLGGGWYQTPIYKQYRDKRKIVLAGITLIALSDWFFSGDEAHNPAGDSLQKQLGTATQEPKQQTPSSKHKDPSIIISEYVRLVIVKTNELPLFDPNDYTKDMRPLLLGFDLIESWTKIYEGQGFLYQMSKNNFARSSCQLSFENRSKPCRNLEMLTAQ